MCHETDGSYRNWREFVDTALSADATADADEAELDVDITEPAIGQHDIDDPALDGPELDD